MITMMNTQRYKWLCLSSLCILITPYLYISRYSNPVADDFIYGDRGRKNSIVSEAIHEYTGWSGRYTSNLIDFLNPLSFNSYAAYKLVPVMIIILLLISYYCFVRMLVQKQLEKITVAIISFLLAALLLNQMPVLSEGIYWYTGAATYQLGNIMALLYISLLICYCREKFLLKNRLVHGIILTCLLIICLGFDEVLMLALDTFAFICLLVASKNKLSQKHFFLYLFVLSCIFSCVVIFSPGVTVRSGMAANNHRFLPSLLFSFAQVVRFFFEWTSSLPLILLSFLYYFLNKELVSRNVLLKQSFYLSPLSSSALLFIIIFIAVFPPYWATGILGQHRTLNVAYYLFLICWFMNLTVWFNYYERELELLKPLHQKVRTMVMVSILLSLMVTKNGYDLLTDLFYGKAQAYDQQMKNRMEQVRMAQDTVYFKPVADAPKTLFLYDITDQPQHWLNQAYNIYFDCKFPVLVKK